MILTPDRRLRVFVSSTLQELADERSAARAAVEALRLTPVLFETAARSHAPRALYRSYIEQSDIFIGIYWERYGWIAPDMEVSGIEDEYTLASGLPRLIYVKSGEPEERLKRFLDRVAAEDVSYKRFDSAEQLRGFIENDLVVTLSEGFYAAAEETVSSEVGAGSRLPAQLSSFVGRKREVKELARLLGDDKVRLVTLIGPGGIGKTRLAVEVARKLEGDSNDGTFFVPLASLRDPQLVPDALSKALGLRPADGIDLLEAVRGFLGPRRTVLVLDNFEQLLAAAPVIGELLEVAPGLQIIATSRAALRLRGEHIFEVEPLGLPKGSLDSEQLRRSDAVELFVERATAVQPDLVVNESGLDTIAEICRRLDGLPLAIELAAVQTRILPLERVLERLSERLTALTGGARDMPERHQRLRDTIEWSYQLLDGDAKRLFAMLGAFRGGFTLEAVETICGTEVDVLLTLSTLLDHSLVRNESRGQGEPRFLMLEVIRDYAAEALAGTSDDETTHDRHASFYAEMAIAARNSVGSTKQREVLDRLDDDIDNLRAALGWMLERGQADRAAHALLSTWYFWWSRAHLREGRRWGRQTLEHDLQPLGRARALAFEAGMAFWQSDYDAALPAFGEAAHLFESEKDPDGIALTGMALGLVEGFLGDFEAGMARISRSIELYERVNDRWGVVSALTSLGWLQSVGDRFDETDDRLRYALDVAEDLGSPADTAMAELNLARFLIHEDRSVDALPYLTGALDRLAALHHIGATSNVIDAIALLAASRKRWEDALALATAADTIRAGIAFQNPAPHLERIANLRADAERELGRDKAARVTDEASAADFDRAVEISRAALDSLSRELSPA